MARVAVDGAELEYERRGSGPPLLLVQGMGANGAHWGEPFLSALERDFELIVYDHRGAGRSSPLDGELTIARLAADALALLDAIGAGAVHVLGMSMGGMVGQELALGTPERVRTLTLGGTSCGGPQSRPTSPEFVRRLTTAVLSRDQERMLRTGFELVVSPAFAGDPGAFAAFAAAAKERPPTIPLLLAQKAAVDGHDTYHRLRHVRVPTLVVHGAADELVPSVNGDLVASLIPGARLELLDGVGHLFYWERPERAAAIVRDFALGGEDAAPGAG